jgi:ribulose bisphosphate carboxylase small subunit
MYLENKHEIQQQVNKMLVKHHEIGDEYFETFDFTLATFRLARLDMLQTLLIQIRKLWR